jgi:ABC-type proline/glycine betaine transport system ATPase subunit
MSEG